MAHPRDGSRRATHDRLYQGWLWPALWEHFMTLFRGRAHAREFETWGHRPVRPSQRIVVAPRAARPV
jgi:hypothetical protein